MEQFDSMLSPIIDQTLGQRCRSIIGYQYSEIIRSLMSVYFCGGSCVEDVTSHLMRHLSYHPTLRLPAKDDWQDAADDIHDLVSFYKTQIAAWRKLLAALAQFADNREALNKVPQAATALAELALIRDNPQPYGQVNRIEPLVAAVTTVNEQLAQEKREKALLSIDEKLAVVQKQLNTAAATAELSNKALKPLQDLKARIAGLTSIAQILYLQGQGGDAMDEAITLVEAAAAKPTPVLASPGDAAKPVQTGHPNVPALAPKATRVVRAAEFSNQPYLETESEVDAYLARLKSELLSVVRAGQKARVQ